MHLPYSRSGLGIAGQLSNESIVEAKVSHDGRLDLRRATRCGYRAFGGRVDPVNG